MHIVTTAPMSRRSRAALATLPRRRMNFSVDERHGPRPEDGWVFDDYRKPLPPEPPGSPLPDGSWSVARRILHTYEFADPRIVRAAYPSDRPLPTRHLLLEGRFFGLRFPLGLRVSGVTDANDRVDGRPVRRWGWSYATLEGHLEEGEMYYEVRKWLDTGAVEFRISAFSRAAPIPNPVVRLGFRLFGRTTQRRFARRALVRMDRLVRARVGTPAR